MQHATVDVSSSGIVGYQVWEIFDRGWKKNQDEKHHLCGVVQELDGQLVTGLDGCDDCEASYEVTVSFLETDCDPTLVDPSLYDGVRAYAFGAVPPGQGALDPFPGRSLGWYLSWDNQVAEFMGFAFPATAGTPADDGATGWAVDQRYELEPAYAWEL